MDENKDQDRQLFSQIAIDVREHPNRYSRVGKWLDKYCEGRRKDIKKRRQALLHRCFLEARRYLLDKYKEQDFIPEDEARRIILITWLLTDPDAEKADLNITQFEKWLWEPANSIFGDSRGKASSFWRQNAHVYSPWMRLVRIAWKTIPAERKRTGARLKGVVKGLYGLTIERIAKAYFDKYG